MKDDDRYAVYALIEQKIPNDEIAEQLELSLSTIIRLRKQYVEHKAAGTLHDIANVDRLLIEATAKSLDLNQEGKELTQKLDTYDVLCADLQKTASAINTRLKSLVLSADDAAELSVITDTLCALQTAFVTKAGGTQVNVQQNFGSADNGAPAAANYSAFLGDKPGA